MMAAEVVLSLKDKFPNIRLIAIVPFRGQSSRWASSEKERYHQILAKTDKVVVLSKNYFRGCLLRRNDYMLSHCCGVIAYYDDKPQGGTFYTVRKAERMEMDMVNICGKGANRPFNAYLKLKNQQNTFHFHFYLIPQKDIVRLLQFLYSQNL